ncbi:AAA family ATPase [bacterium]|nr:AAA family ATPase [bacterium]
MKMRLTEITFHNFRCFKDTHSVHFSSDEEKTVTLFHAQNGSGKTTFLNAILWTFYGKTTGKFELADKIVNDDALKEGRTTAFVDVTFEHQGKTYTLKRVYDHASKKSDLRLFIVEGGSVKPHTSVRDVETFIESVIPSQMAPYFFFDGEHAETLTGENKKSAVGKAVRSILGCDIAEEAIDDLKFLHSKVRAEFQKLATSEELQKAYKQREDNEIIFEKANESISDRSEEIKSADDEFEALSGEIAKLDAAKKIDEEHSRADRDLQRLQNKWKDIDKPFYQWIDKYSFSLVGAKTLKISSSVVEKHEFEARIPEQYSEPFVQKLLSDELCICGRPLKEHSDEAKKVNALLENAANSEHIQRFNRVNGTLGKLKSLQTNSFDRLQLAINGRNDLDREIEDQKNKVANLKKQLTAINNSHLQDLLEKRTKVKNHRDSLVIQRQNAKNSAGIANEEVKRLNHRIGELEKQGAVGGHLKQRVMLLEKLIKRANERLDGYVEDARGFFQAKVNFYLEKYARKEMSVKISSDFAISVKFSGGSVLPKSSGENQFVSMIFTAALVNFAKIRSGASGDFLQPGTIAPLFLDAPLGQLDRYYQLRIAEMLPELADQLVLLLTDSQGNPDVLETLSEDVGQHWIIKRHNKEEYSEGKPTDEITINGESYTRCFYSEKYEYSSFEAVG